MGSQLLSTKHKSYYFALVCAFFSVNLTFSADAPSNIMLPLVSLRELLSGEKEGLLQLPSDKALLSDSIFHPLVEKYAAVGWSILPPTTALLATARPSNLIMCYSLSGWRCLLCRLCRGSPETFWIGVMAIKRFINH